MTIDALQERKRELLARQQEELALQAEGRGDTFALYFLREELLDVNAQLRSLAPRRRLGMGRACEGLADRQQYEDWLHGEAEDAPVPAGLAESAEVLTARQREVWELHLAGMGTAQIAHRLYLDRSTVARTLRRTRAALQAEVKRAAAAEGVETLDMGDPAAAELVLPAVTPTQAAYLYLYYAEWLSLREIGALVDVDHTAVLRTIRRGLKNIGGALGYQAAAIVHMEALDGLCYNVYAGLETADTIVPRERRPSAARAQKVRERTPPLPPVEVCIRGGPWTWQRRGERRRGKLLTALLERRRQGESLFGWLVTVFRRLAGGTRKSAARWVRRNVKSAKEERPC